jgi:beta-xylosidase
VWRIFAAVNAAEVLSLVRALVYFAPEMKMVVPLLLFTAFSFPSQGVESPPSKNAAKTYRNPLLPDMADPHVIRVDGKYYLYGTTHTRGYDAFVSDDLVHWTNKGLAFDDPRRGAWAPDVFHNKRGDGKFYLYYTDNIPDAKPGGAHKQIGVAVSDSPLGPFQDKAILATNAIDAHLFQDDDGKFYLYYVDLVEGFKIRAQPMGDPLTKAGDTTIVIRPTEDWEKISGHVTEGPCMLKRKGVYYLMYSGTGADSPNYGIGYATAKSPLGPFEKFAGNPIAHRGGKVLGPGHHCVIEGPDKKVWLVYHQKWDDGKNFKRFLAIDPLWFDDQGVLHAKVSRETDEPAP